LSDKREVPHWHCNKRWTDISKTRQALAILESSKFEDKAWNEGKQAFYAQLLNKEGLSDSTNPRSTRAILGTFKFFGFAWTKNKKLIITEAGKEFVHGNVKKTLKLQLLKWQYPNIFEAKGGVAPYTRTMRLFPFRVLIRLAEEIGPVHEDELALFVWKTKTDELSEIGKTKQDILGFRKLSDPEKRKKVQSDFLFITNHEYEAHLRPYILATDLCLFDSKQRLLSINKAVYSEIKEILEENPEVKTDWKDETEWFEYFGDTKYYQPPVSVQFTFLSKKGPAARVYAKVFQNGRETWGITEDDGTLSFSLYEKQKFTLETILPKNGEVLQTKSLLISPKVRKVEIKLARGPISRVESIDVTIEKINQLLKKHLDDEISDRLKMKARVEKHEIDKKQLRSLRGGRFEELVYRLLVYFKGRVFTEVIWNGKIGEWGLPVPAQKLSEETGKKLPDILVFQDNDLYAVETTLLRGRAQWEKPEAVSVPEHVENMINEFKGKNVQGLFIAGELDSSVQINLITRAINQGYKIVPMEAPEFLDMIKLLQTSGKTFWRDNFNNLWNIHKRNITKASS